MKNIAFQIPDIKKNIETSFNLSDSNNFNHNQSFIDIKQKELESGLFCTQINCFDDDTVKWNYQSRKNDDFLIFCFWIEMKSEKNGSINSHIFNIISSSSDFSFQLKKKVLYKGYILSLSQSWIKRSINSNIMKSYLLQFSDTKVKSLYFLDNEITGLIHTQKPQKWQLNVECWQLMGIAFEKIASEIQNEKRASNALNKKKTLDNLRNYITENIHRPELNFQYALNILKKQYPFIEEEDYRSLSKYILEIRMSKAVKLLEDGKFNIHEISQKVGFSAIKTNQFIKIFKRRYGVTPSQYTKKAKL